MEKKDQGFSQGKNAHPTLHYTSFEENSSTKKTRLLAKVIRQSKQRTQWDGAIQQENEGVKSSEKGLKEDRLNTRERAGPD